MAKTKKSGRSKSTKKSTTAKKSTSRKKKNPTPTPAQALGVKKGEPVHVDSTTARSDNDALAGHFAKVVSGKHQGRYGVFDTVAEYNDQDGYPKRVILVTRDEHAERLVVNYSDLRPAEAGFRGSF